MIGGRRVGMLAGVAMLLIAGAACWAEGADPAVGEAADVASLVPRAWIIAPVASVIGLIFAAVFYKQVMKNDEGTEKMRRIAGYVREGADAYLGRQYRVVAIVFAILFVLFVVLALLDVQNPFVPAAFLAGGFFSGLCGWLGMRTATRASARTTNRARVSLNSGLQVAFRSGAVMGLVVVGFGLLNIAIWYLAMVGIFRYNLWGMSKELALRHGFLEAGEAWSAGVLALPGFVPAVLGEITSIMLTFGIGASLMALFARVGGGIYTKAADVGADLVGKVEAGIPEDDARNPATIADNVGDNVGDVAGMGADLYESYVNSILATSALGAAIPVGVGLAPGVHVIAPMVVAGAGILFSILGIYLVRSREDATQKNLLRALLTGTFTSTVLVVAALVVMWLVGMITLGILGSVVAGLVAGVIIGQSTEWFTSDEYRWTKGVAAQSDQGAAPLIIEGMAVGMFSSAIPVLAVAAAVMCAFVFSGGLEYTSQGLYGVAFAAVGMLSTLGITLASDAYGPIADNAGGNAEMAGLPPEVREKTDALDALGNTTAATGKGFAIGSAALTAMALLAAYVQQVKVWLGTLASKAPEGVYKVISTHTAVYLNKTMEQAQEAARTLGEGWSGVGLQDARFGEILSTYDLTLMNPALLAGLFIGAMAAFVFCGMTMRAVGRSAGRMVAEVRRQFGLLRRALVAGGMSAEDAAKPDNWPETVDTDEGPVPNYAHCVEIATVGAQKEMMVPSLLAIVVPVAVGLVLGVPGVMGLLAGALTAGFSLACMLNNGGGCWDNAKKWIEKGNLGGKGSEPHKAAVVGDTVGDPFKDTSGPSLNILIKLMSIVSVSFAGLVIAVSPAVQKLIGLL